MSKKVCLGRYCPVLGVAALGVVALSLSLGRAKAEPQKDGLKFSAGVGKTDTAGAYERRTIRVGPGIPANLQIPMADPITVDYRNDEATLARQSGVKVSVGARRDGLGSVAADTCRNDAQCNDCNPCTLDVCATGTCTGGPHNGFACTAATANDDCLGTCSGGVRSGGGCGSDLDCCGDGGAIGNGTCVPFVCATSPDRACVNPVIPSTCKGGTRDRLDCTSDADCTGSPNGVCTPQFVSGAECDDGLECNGPETCSVGACNPAAPLCANPLVCDEDDNTCLAACTVDADCVDDGSNCTIERCDVATGVCGVDPILPCGPGATCTASAKHCSNAPTTGCTATADCPTTPPGSCVDGEVLVCGEGRCCDGVTCSNVLFADCASPKTWLSSSTACGLIGDTLTADLCPVYGGGMAPLGPYNVEVGPITIGTCGDLGRVGDDYTVAGGGSGYITVNLLRFVHSAQVSARIAVEFWDVTSGPNPILIEDIFVPNGINTGVHGPLVRQVILDPPLKVRESGVFAVSIAANFSPNGTIAMVSTDAANVGGNDPGLSYVMVGPTLTAVDFMGQCTGGTRDGLFCDSRAGNTDCVGGGTCTDVPDVLAYELVATTNVAAPTGGCCVATGPQGGTCTQKLGWVCEDEGNVFRGEGVNCAVCLASSTIPDGTQCNTTADCGDGVCTEAVCASDSPIHACLDNSDCTVGTCELIAQCTVQACCNNTTGACTTVLGIGTSCPAGTTTRNFATSCEPDACPQPVDKSRDNCTLVTPTVVPVPAPGDPPISVTLTGSNVPATFDDWNQGVCVDANGVNGAPCDPNVTPDPNVNCNLGEVCTRLCNSGIFNPGDTTRDPGWWVGFSIDRCADVRIDTCETVPLVRPAWAFISEGCPCVNFIGNAGIRAPLGRGVGTDGGARGAPFCTNDDNFWQTFRNLPAGTYYYPVYAAPESDIAAPVVGGPGGTFQFHVATQACEIAACCLPESYCVNDPALELAGIALDGSGAPIPCTGTGQGTCAAGQFCRFCALDNQTNCELANGAWLSKPVTPAKICLGGAEDGTEDCADDAACPDGICLTVGSITSCGLAPDGSDSPCNSGACCTGPGACDDLLPQSTVRMDRTTCDNTANGVYFGGATCNFPTPPCPVCLIAATPGNCIPSTGGFIFQMDRNIGGGGRRVADDFIAKTPAIGQFCFQPCFIRVNAAGTNIGECADLTRDGFGPPPDAYQVRFYEDANGFPGAELPNSPGPNNVPIAAKRLIVGTRCLEYSVVFNPPIDGFVVDRKYWVEFSGFGNNVPPLGDGCRTYLLNNHLDGNHYALQESDHFDEVGWSNQDNTQFLMDFSFCIEGGLAIPPPVTGACCRPCGVTATCTDNVAWEDCVTSFNIGDGAASITPHHVGDGFFFANQECSQIDCTATGSAGGGCPGAPSGIPGEDCVNPEVVTLGNNVTSVLTVDTLCSTTDGRTTFVNGCDTGTGVSFESDKWFEVVSNCDGKMQVDFCGDSDYDTAIAVYKGPDGTGECPVGTGGCEPDESTLLTGKCVDTDCKLTGGSPSFETFTVPNTCFKIRVGGDDDSGTMQLELKCASVTCRTSVQPIQDDILSSTGATVMSTKNRFLSFEAPVPGGLEGNKAVRVKIVSLPGTCEGGSNPGALCPGIPCAGGGTCTGGFAQFNGTTWWVDSPIDSNELPGKTFTDPIAGPSFKSAKLRTTPLYQEWSQFGMIHVYSELIIPSRQRPGQAIEPSIYWIQIIDESCDVNLDEFPNTYSTPLIAQNPRWGDLASSQFRAPDGVVTVTEDVLGVLAKFGNAAGAPIKARAELVGSGLTGPVAGLTGKVEIGDVLAALSAFTGGQYPFAPPLAPPALDAAPPASRAITSR